MQLIRRFNGWSGAIGAVCVGVLVGCGDSGGSTESVSGTGSNSGTDTNAPTTGTDSEPTGSASMSDGTTGAEGGVSESLSGTTEAEGGVSDSLSGTVSSGVESDSNSGGTTGTTGMVSGGGDTTGGSSTGEPVECSTHVDEQTCVEAGCTAVLGSKFVSDDADLCLDPPSFLGCLEPMICDDALTYACKGQVKYQLPNSCLPEGFMVCAAPPDAGMDGWKDCP